MHSIKDAQMYSSSHIQVPDVPGKIVRRKKGNGIYVLYEVARVYDPKRQFNVPESVRNFVSMG